MAERPDSLPLAELVAEQRARLSLSLAAVAKRVRTAAEQEGNKHCGASRQTIHQIEQGRIPHPDALRWLAIALELPLHRVVVAAKEQRMNRRQLLSGAIAVGAGLLLPTARTPLAQTEEITAYLRRVFPEFSTADWLLGCQAVLPSMPRHLAAVEQLLAGASGRARTELLQVGARYGEFTSWLYQDAGNAQAATLWADRSVAWATEAGDHGMVAYAMTRKAHLAADQADEESTVGLAQTAQRYAVTSRVRAIAMLQEAHGHALAGEERTALDRLDTALELADRAAHDEGPGRYLSPGYVELQRSTCWLALGRPGRAIPLLERELAALPAIHRRDRGVYMARLARAYATAGEREQAATVAREAREVAKATGSRRILRELRPAASR
jgi:transcriptional regulator with XRE-family HTH domain